jgi:dCTP deaminase
LILTGSEIEAALERGDITLTPFQKGLLNPNSYNYRLGDHLLLIDGPLIDSRKNSKTHKVNIPAEGYVLMPGNVYLGYTLETIGSSAFVPSLIGRSSLGRLGLFLQITADLGHLGTCHKWTLELKVVQPLRVYAGMRIGQVSFWKPEGAELLDGLSYSDAIDSYAKYSTSAPSMVEKLFI